MSGSDAKEGRLAARAIVLGRGGGRRVPGRGSVTLKATSEQTGGSAGVVEAISAPGEGPRPHIHRDCDELFYVLEGEFSFLLGEETVLAPTGSFVFIPRGTVHAARNVGSETGRVLAVFVPGGAEGAFEAFARASPEKRDGVAERYDSEFVEVRW